MAIMTKGRHSTARRRIARTLAGTMLTALAVSSAQATTYIWTTGNYAPGTTSPDPLTGPDILQISGAGNKSFYVDFTNSSGQVDWQAGNLYFGSGALVTNQGLWRALGDDSFYNTTGGGSFLNTGIFRKETGTGITGINIAFVNSGTIDTLNGTLRFANSGAVFNGGTSFTGTGVTEITAGAAFNGAFNSANLDFAGGVFTGTGAILSGAADFLGGNFAGDWTIASDGGLTIRMAANKFIGGSLVNEGVVTWEQANLYLQGGATVTNDGSWIATGNDTIYVGTGGGTLVNNGLFRKNGGTGTTQIFTPFVNNGTVDAATGTIRFDGSGQVFNDGTSFTGAGTNQIGGSAAFNGAIGSTNLDFAGSVYTGTDAVLNGTADFLGGSFAGGWTIASGSSLTIAAAANKFIGGTFRNEGTVTWEQANLYLQGSATVTNAGSWIATGNDTVYVGTGGGTLVNDGLVRKDGGTGVTQFLAPFVNNGTIDAVTGTIRFDGSGQVFNDGTSFIGAGINQIGGSAAFNGAIGSTNLDFAGSVYTGTDAVLSGTADFLGGTFSGDWAIASGSGLTIATAANKFIGAAFRNEGMVSWTQANLYLQGGAIINNAGSWIATGDDTLYVGTGGGTLVNTGLFQKIGGTGTTTISVPLVNDGLMDVRSGTIALPASFTNDGTLAGTGAFRLSGTLTNAGTMAPGNGGAGIGTLTLDGNFVQTSAGLFDVQIGAGGLADLLLVDGTASLDGVLGLTCASCTLNVGDIFTLLDATGDLTGIFSSVTTSGFNTGFAYSVLYDGVADRVQLRIDDVGTVDPTNPVPEPASWVMMILGMGAVGGVVRRASRQRVQFA